MPWLLRSVIVIRDLNPVIVSTVSAVCTVRISSVWLHDSQSVAGADTISLLPLHHHSASSAVSTVCESIVSVL